MARRRKMVDPEALDDDDFATPRQEEPPLVAAPATVPSLDDDFDDLLPDPLLAEDGGIAKHPVHDSDLEDLGPEDYEAMTEEIARIGIRRGR